MLLYVAGGIHLRIQRNKTDQEDAGQTIAVPELREYWFVRPERASVVELTSDRRARLALAKPGHSAGVFRDHGRVNSQPMATITAPDTTTSAGPTKL